ncbi:MAG: DUF2911 domain-containing protein [Gemmatimonadaceae bacterium]
MMKRVFLPATVAVLISGACSSTSPWPGVPLAALAAADTSSLTARLGVDTIAIERIIRTPRRVEAEIVVRSPRTSLQRHVADLDAMGNLSRLEVATIDPATGALLGKTVYTRDADSMRVATERGDERTSRSVAAVPGVLPFIDLVHWPFDIALRRLRQSGAASVDAPILSGQRVSPFPLALAGTDSATITHPTRGTMRLQVLPDGSIRTLDAGATTRALIVTRGTGADITALARDYAARDAAGRGIGELSGRGGGEAQVLGATITLDFGQPVKRGRHIWGGLVDYGALWRTGANRATHFKTDRALRFGSLDVPAGEYTLFSIPAADGGLLIINRQTGQNGQQYDEKQDLGRVRMTVRPLDEVVEVFAISAREENGRGLLALQWDNVERVAGFTVANP